MRKAVTSSGLASWTVWHLPARARRYVLAVDVAAICATIFLAARTTWRLSDLATFAIFVGCAAVSIETFRRMGPQPRRTDGPHENLLSMVLFPTVLVLPPVYAALLPIPVLIMRRVRVDRRLAPLKSVFNAAAFSLTGVTAAALHNLLAPPLSDDLRRLGSLQAWQPVLAVFVAGGVFLVMNKALVAGIVRRIAPTTPWRSLTANPENWVLNVSDICMGVLLALAWSASPVFIVIALPPVLLLQRAVLHTHLVEAARTDAKTGLSNPSYWRDAADQALVRARSERRNALARRSPVAVLVIDLDNFKSINDHYGHLVGDTIIRAVADVLRGAVRPTDVVGRFGGEEFEVLLTDTDPEGAWTVAERIVRRVSALRYPLPNQNAVVRVTASVGGAIWGDGLEIDQLLAAADTAMYRAKAAGGNRVVVQTGPEPEPPFEFASVGASASDERRALERSFFNRTTASPADLLGHPSKRRSPGAHFRTGH